MYIQEAIDMGPKAGRRMYICHSEPRTRGSVTSKERGSNSQEYEKYSNICWTTQK